MRACDARSFEILDKVFLKEPVDTFYASRREMGTVITLACTKPDETCFCRSFDIDPANPAGDVSCWMDEETLYWQANTAKGETLTSELPMLEDGGEEAVKAQQEELHVILEKLPLAQLDLSKVGAGKTEALFNRPEWKSLSESCLGCGTCTFVCPTCQCYDVQEFNTGQNRPALPLLGQLHVLRLYQNVGRAAKTHAARALPAAFYAQAGLFPGQ